MLRSNRTGWIAPGFTLIELMIVVAIIGVLASIAIPAFVKYVNQAKTTEIAPNLKAIGDGAATYYTAEHYTPEGLPLAERQFPTTTSAFADTTPSRVPADILPGTKFLSTPADWDKQPWIGLKFRIVKPHYYRYRYFSTNSGSAGVDRFSARAEGDLDADGLSSRFNLTGFADKDGEIQVTATFLSDGTAELE